MYDEIFFVAECPNCQYLIKVDRFSVLIDLKKLDFGLHMFGFCQCGQRISLYYSAKNLEELEAHIEIVVKNHLARKNLISAN
jgi:hypothetical protein